MRLLFHCRTQPIRTTLSAWWLASFKILAFAMGFIIKCTSPLQEGFVLCFTRVFTIIIRFSGCTATQQANRVNQFSHLGEKFRSYMRGKLKNGLEGKKRFLTPFPMFDRQWSVCGRCHKKDRWSDGAARPEPRGYELNLSRLLPHFYTLRHSWIVRCWSRRVSLIPLPLCLFRISVVPRRFSLIFPENCWNSFRALWCSIIMRLWAPSRGESSTQIKQMKGFIDEQYTKISKKSPMAWTLYH